MKVATKANVRTAQAAKTSLAQALKVSFTGGSVMGLGVSGLAVLGLGGLFLVLKQMFFVNGDPSEMLRTIEVLTGFSLGAESIALFARVGGGIYTKAADVGADLVGKVEAGIPEDDPRNPATIADNVGDNVGDGWYGCRFIRFLCCYSFSYDGIRTRSNCSRWWKISGCL